MFFSGGSMNTSLMWPRSIARLKSSFSVLTKYKILWIEQTNAGNCDGSDFPGYNPPRRLGRVAQAWWSVPICFIAADTGFDNHTIATIIVFINLIVDKTRPNKYGEIICICVKHCGRCAAVLWFCANARPQGGHHSFSEEICGLLCRHGGNRHCY